MGQAEQALHQLLAARACGAGSARQSGRTAGGRERQTESSTARRSGPWRSTGEHSAAQQARPAHPPAASRAHPTAPPPCRARRPPLPPLQSRRRQQTCAWHQTCAPCRPSRAWHGAPPRAPPRRGAPAAAAAAAGRWRCGGGRRRRCRMPLLPGRQSGRGPPPAPPWGAVRRRPSHSQPGCAAPPAGRNEGKRARRGSGRGRERRGGRCSGRAPPRRPIPLPSCHPHSMRRAHPRGRGRSGSCS